MISLNEACERALDCFSRMGMLKKIYSIGSTSDLWLFDGRWDDDDSVEYGNNPVAVNKETGNTDVFSISQNLDIYYSSEPIPIPQEYRQC